MSRVEPNCKRALRVHAALLDNGLTNAFHQVPELKPLYESAGLVSFVAYLRKKTLRLGGVNGRLSWEAWEEAASELGLCRERARVLWRGALNAEIDCRRRPWLSADLFSDSSSMPLIRFGVVLFLSCIIPRPPTRELEAAWMDPPAPDTIIEDASVRSVGGKLLPENSTQVIDLNERGVESIPLSQRSIQDMRNLAVSQMKRLHLEKSQSNNWRSPSFIAALRRNPEMFEYNSIQILKILVVSLGLSTRAGVVCADAVPPWPLRPQQGQEYQGIDIDWNDISIPLSCLEHLRFLYELSDVPLTAGWLTEPHTDPAREPSVSFADAVTCLTDIGGIAVGSCLVRNATIPWLHVRSIAGVRLLEDLYPHHWEFSALCRSSIVKRVVHDDIQHVDIRGCQDCSLDLIPQPTALLRIVSIRQSLGCTVFVGACDALTIVSSEKVTVLAAVRADVRIINSFDCNVFVFCKERPTVFGDNRLVSIAPAGFSFPGIDLVLKAHGFQLERNRWNEPFDVETGGTPPSTKVAILPPNLYWPPTLAWQGVGDITTSPWSVPSDYLEAYQQRYARAESTRRVFRERLAGTKGATRSVQQLVHQRFRDWLSSSGHMWQIRNLIRMDRMDVSPQRCTDTSPMDRGQSGLNTGHDDEEEEDIDNDNDQQP
ncbi:hypothetical protein CCYA_CCYA13G3436 [Cyanidiococcus yangmingshanensis]|nr:hypothetical protein CCYA_CCYA13G3436 [Cyanidiococcus yangmingshanensis]